MSKLSATKEQETVYHKNSKKIGLCMVSQPRPAVARVQLLTFGWDMQTSTCPLKMRELVSEGEQVANQWWERQGDEFLSHHRS